MIVNRFVEIIEPIRPHFPKAIYVIGLSGIFGASMILSLFSDLLIFLTPQIYLFYIIAARIYNWQLSVLWSLFNLFRGILDTM